MKRKSCLFSLIIFSVFLILTVPFIQASECNDGIDNDRDGLIDFSDDTGCLSSEDKYEDNSLDAEGWTIFTPSADTRIIYVSNSLGNDLNDGLSEATPKKTLSAGFNLLRDGRPDWLLLKRGDTWVGEYFSNWDKNGRSITEPMVVGAYGPLTADRPLILPGNRSFFTHNAGGSFYLNYLSVVSLHARGSGTNSVGGIGVGFDTIGPGTGLLIEDCMFDFFGAGIVVQGEENNGYMNNVTVRRNIVVDSNTGIASLHSSGIFVIRINGFTIEENVFDYNGWRAGIYPGDIFNHNMYLSSLCTNVRVNRNIISRASSHGIQMRSGAECKNNLLVRNSIALFVNKNPSTVHYNVILEGKDIDSSDPNLIRGWGIETLTTNGADVAYNIVAHKLSLSNAFAFRASRNEGSLEPNIVTFRNNIAYDWTGNSFEVAGTNNEYTSVAVRDNTFVLNNGSYVIHRPSSVDINKFTYSRNKYDGLNSNWRIGTAGHNLSNWQAASGEADAVFSPVSFPDSNRSVASYNQTKGGPATFDAFIAECRLQRKGNWREAYTASVVNDYIREGFGMGSYVPVNTPPIINAGPDTIVSGNNANLNATVLDDGLPSSPGLVSVQWSQVAQDPELGQVTFSNIANAQTTVTFPHFGTYVLRLTAYDGQLYSSDDIQITTNDGPATSMNTNGDGFYACQDPKNKGTLPICFNNANQSHIDLTIYTTNGREVKKIFDGDFGPGPQTVMWDKKNGSGSEVAAGIYVVMMEANGKKYKTKVAVIK